MNITMDSIFSSKSAASKIEQLKVIVFDLDYTLWPFWVDTHVTPPFSLKNGKVVDSYGTTIKHYPEVPEVLSTLSAQGYELGVASRTGEIQGARQLLQLFNWDKYFKYKEIFPGCKVTHLANIKKSSGYEYSEMIFFDDEHRNIHDINGIGVTSILVDNGFSFSGIFSSESPTSKIEQLKVIVFDLDYTLWPFWVDTHVTPPFSLKNCKVVDSYDTTIKHYPEVPEVLSTLFAQGYELGIASRTKEIQGARQLLQLFNWDKFFKYKEIFHGCKVTHFANIKKSSGYEYSEMIFFDDEHRNIHDINAVGVTSILVENGVSKSVILNGFKEFLGKNKI